MDVQKKKMTLLIRDVAKPRSGIPKSLRGRFFYGKFYVGKSFFFREILRSLFLRENSVGLTREAVPSIIFFLPAAPFFIFCSAKRVR